MKIEVEVDEIDLHDMETLFQMRKSLKDHVNKLSDRAKSSLADPLKGMCSYMDFVENLYEARQCNHLAREIKKQLDLQRGYVGDREVDED